MPILRKPPTAGALKLQDLATSVRREAEGAEGDPSDTAMIAGAAGLSDALRAESAELEILRGRMVRLARQTAR